MSLSNTYFDYPWRSYGYDHERYEWSMLADRPKIYWPDDKQLAVWINLSLQFYPLNQSDMPFKIPNGMRMPYPDLRHFSLRDYGNRVGIFRCLKAIDRYGVRPTVAINSQLANDTPYLLHRLLDRDIELLCHGWNMDNLHYGGQELEEERDLVKRSVDTLVTLSGHRVRGWLSPARNQSWNTPELLTANGIEYCADWVNDDMPYCFNTKNGALTILPLPQELEDQFVIAQNMHSEDSWVDQVKDAINFLLEEATQQGGRMLGINVHPWLMGHPHRIACLEAVLEYITERTGVWQATSGEIMDAFNTQTEKQVGG